MRSLVPFLAVLLSGRLLAAEFWVSPSGKDSNPGTKALPFATLERARGASRAARGGTVWIRAGTYRLERGLALGAEDSGVAYRAAPGEEARLSGAIPVREADARKATDPAVLARLDPAARGRVVEIDAAGLGLRHVARFPDNFGDGGGIVQIYFEGRRLPLARWPNRGYSRMVRVTDMGDWSKDATRRGGSFLYEGDRPERWGKAIQEGLWLDGFWRVPWTPEKVRVASIDAAKKQIVHAVPVNGGIASKYARPNGSGQEPWCAVNVLEEIDTPGEWSLDFRARKIYLWPPAEVRDGSIRIADSDGALLSLRGASRVAITGIVFEGGLGNGIEIEGGADNRVAGCTFRNLGGTGAVVNGGLRHGIESCDFHGLGQGGVSLSGGDRARLTPSGHFVVNSHFHHLGEVKKTYTPAVNLAYSGRTAVGMRIAHNLIHDLPHAAVLYAGNDHVIELNEVHNVALDSGDVGAFYTWNDWTSRGNIVRHNFVHHSTAANAFYMDDGDSGDTVEGNVVYRTQYGPFIGGGHDNTVRNNLVIEARNGLHMDARGVPRRYDVTDRHKMNLLGSIDWRNPPWSTRYPDLLRILERPELPVGNLLADNALVGCGQPLHLEKPAKDGDDRLRFSTVRNNIVVAATAEAGFVDAGRLDFRLRPDSPLHRPAAGRGVRLGHGPEGVGPEVRRSRPRPAGFILQGPACCIIQPQSLTGPTGKSSATRKSGPGRQIASGGSMSSFKSGVFAAGLVLFLLLAPASAQDPRGTILGRVIDSSGAAVPNAEVRATNENTGVSAAAKANEAGNFVMPYLLSGTYVLQCEFAGFKKWVRPGIQVRINDSVEVNIDLQVGATSETIEVSASTPLLATADASLGQVIDERRVLELPQFAGNAMDLVHLAPGTINGTNLRLRKAGFNSAPSTFSTDGSGNNQNEFSIDGVSNTFSDGTAPRVAFSPPQFAISEFKIQTSTFDAALGHTMGSTVNVSIKSGTNSLHGEAHEWFRHSALDAPTIFQNRSGQKISIYQDNRYGASAGAPVFIPKLYNGKNRTFWFVAYEANKFGNPDSGGNITSSVPTEKMHRGDFSEFLALGATYQYYDPRSTRLEGARYVRTPIPNNIIPQSQLDPVGVALMNLYPTPNQPGTRDFQSNFYRSGKALEDYWAFITRIDHAFSERHRMFFRVHRDFWEEDKNRAFNNDVVGVILNRNNKAVAFDDVFVFSPSLLFNFRYGLTYQDFPERRASQGYDLSKLGFSQNLISLVAIKDKATIPNVTGTGFTNLGAWESGDGVTASTTNSFVGNFTKMHGNHTFRFGPEFRVYRESRNRYQTMLSPQLAYSATYMRANDTAANPARGGEAAAMMMGIPAGSMGISDSYVEQDKYFSLYLADDWKVTKKLTLNIGLRYEYESPVTERFNRGAIHYSTAANPLNDAARANYARSPIPELPAAQFQAIGGLTFANVAPNGRSYWTPEKRNFQPRFGFAYQALPKTIVRGGYGIFVASIGVNYTNTNQTGFSITTPIQASLDNGVTYRATNANPLPTGLIAPAGASGGLLTNIGQGVSFFRDQRKHPYAQRWSLGIQQELPGKFMIEASYVGNRNTRLNINRELSYTPAQYLSTSPVRDQATIDFLGRTSPNPYNGLNPIYGTTISRGNLLRPYNQFSSVQITGDPAGYSWYHSLQTRIERRFGNGFTLQSSYTWSKVMEATEFMNSQDPMPYEVIASLDRTHRLTGSGIWEVPVGRKRKFGAGMPSALNFMAGGWQLSGLYQHQSGAPLGFGNRIFNGDLHGIVLPNDKRSVNQWFVPAAQAGFETNASRQLGSNLRTFPLRFNATRGPNQDKWDFAILKVFKIREKLDCQFRAEAFNALNHPNLYDPNTDPTSASWGVITGQDTPRSWQLSLKLVF